MAMKFAGMGGTAAAIASIGFPLPDLFAWLAAFFELGLVLAFLTGAFFTEAAILAVAYVLFLGFVFYGPSTWPGNLLQMGLFINHLTFVAGLLLAAVHGPGKTLALDWSLPWPSRRSAASANAARVH
jgi:putative oxidoreductase